MYCNGSFAFVKPLSHKYENKNMLRATRCSTRDPRRHAPKQAHAFWLVRIAVQSVRQLPDASGGIALW
jgi:hypothetical protein